MFSGVKLIPGSSQGSLAKSTTYQCTIEHLSRSLKHFRADVMSPESQNDRKELIAIFRTSLVVCGETTPELVLRTGIKVKVPISSKFLFSYMILCITQ